MALALVMPVYTEEACIAGVIDSWRRLLTALGIRFELIVINDGSLDGTAGALAPFAEDERIRIVNKQNSGHGPSILLGYHLAVKAADWVFQCDSDDEISADYFGDLWVRREDFAALFGTRTGRRQSASRKLITLGSRLAVRLRYGHGISDVNTPYRLMRADLLNQIIQQIPADTFAPNIIISGVLSKNGIPVYEHPVRNVSRQTGVNSLRNLKLWNSAVKSLWQLIWCCPVISYPSRAGQN
jgi:glycosyltransferase involved in cell wall biosynthesis